MANLCSNYVIIRGDEKILQGLADKITKKDKAFLLEFPLLCVGDFYGIYNVWRRFGARFLDLINPRAGELFLDISSKWSPPEKMFQKLSETYPTLTIEVSYEEPAMELYGKLSYENGECTLDQPMDTFDYLMEFNEDFADEVSNIKDSDYKEFKETYLLTTDYRKGFIWESNSYLLEPLLVERTRDEDLAMLIGALDSPELLERKIKGVSWCQEKIR